MSTNIPEETYIELFKICEATQDYFWKQVVNKFNHSEEVAKFLQKMDGGNKEYTAIRLKKGIEEILSAFSIKTAIVLLGIITRATTQGADGWSQSLQRFDSRLQEITTDYLANPLLMRVIKEANEARGKDE